MPAMFPQLLHTIRGGLHFVFTANRFSLFVKYGGEFRYLATLLKPERTFKNPSPTVEMEFNLNISPPK